MFFYAHFGAMILWMCQPGPTFWTLFVGLINLPFHTMEIRFYITKKLMLIVDECGPVEVETIFATILFLSGLASGNVYEVSMADTFGVDNEYLKMVQWKYFLMGLIGFLYILFANDNLSSAFAKDA